MCRYDRRTRLTCDASKQDHMSVRGPFRRIEQRFGHARLECALSKTGENCLEALQTTCSVRRMARIDACRLILLRRHSWDECEVMEVKDAMAARGIVSACYLRGITYVDIVDSILSGKAARSWNMKGAAAELSDAHHQIGYFSGQKEVFELCRRRLHF